MSTRVGAALTGADESYSHVPPVETHFIRSRYVQETFKIQVMRPAQRRGDAARFPVIYATDGNLAFDVLKGISYSMQLSSHHTPPFILVGISYPADNPYAGLILRARDLTFADYPQLGIRPPPLEGVLLPEKDGKDFYGAEEFSAFIEHELIPFVDERYPTLPGQRIYFGHSAGAGFGLYTLFTKRWLFSHFIASSPGLIYHGISGAGIHYQEHEFLLRYAQRFISSAGALPDTRLYLSVGSEEEFEPGLQQWRMVSSFRRMTQLLNSEAIAGLTLTTEILPGETHATAWPVAFMHGVRAVLGHSL